MLLSPPYVLAADLGLVSLLTSQLGVTTPQAQSGAGAIFKYAKDKITPNDFAKVAGAVPNMDSLLAAAPKTPEATPSEPTLSEPGSRDLSEPGARGGDSTLGGFAGKLGGLQGLSGSFGQLGLQPDMVGKFVPIVVDYVKSSGGGSVGALLQVHCSDEAKLSSGIWPAVSAAAVGIAKGSFPGHDRAVQAP